MSWSKKRGHVITFVVGLKCCILLIVRCLIFGGGERFDFFRLETSELSVASDDCVLSEASLAL